jgi:pyrroline-5-carboxylate reductase
VNSPTPLMTIIGAGTMATYLLSGLQRAGVDLTHVCITDKDPKKLHLLAQQFAVQTSQDNNPAIMRAAVVILAIKPQSLVAFAQESASAFAHAPLVISILAGIPIAQLHALLGPLPFVRAMPNLLVSLSQGNTVLFAPIGITAQQHKVAESYFIPLGITQWVDEEKQLDAYTVLTGCGPGYVFFMMQCVIDAAAELGIGHAQAKTAVLQLFSGAAQMAAQNPATLIELQQQVASKKGVTENLLAKLKAGHVDSVFKQAFLDAYAHGQQLQHQKEEK